MLIQRFAEALLVCLQVKKVSLHPDKQPKPPAKQAPVMKDKPSEGSKDVSITLLQKQCLFLSFVFILKTISNDFF